MKETGWLPDFLYREGRFESGIALMADEQGRVKRFSTAPEDLQKAQRLVNRALLPGLVNVHSHSFQRAIRARTEQRSGIGQHNFWTWREAMYHAAKALTPDDIYDCARMAFLEMAAGGITAVGEFHYLHHKPDGAYYDDPNLLAERIVTAAREVGLRIALLRTAYARAGWQKEPNPGQARFITADADVFLAHTDSLGVALEKDGLLGKAWVGVAPHSVRALPVNYVKVVAAYARAHGMKIHMHAAEQPAEIEACLAEHGCRPIELLHREGVLGGDFTAIHAIHITGQEIVQLAQSKTRIGACPTTERNLGDGIGPGDAWSSAGVETCFGSDSNVQIDLLEDAREFEYHLRLKRLERAVLAAPNDTESLAKNLFASATVVGAESIGAPGGTLEVGRPADFFTVDLNDVAVAGADKASLLSHVVFSVGRAAIQEVYVGGKPVLQNGAHALQQEIIERFSALQKRLWN